jgi:hypothetical protein
MHTRRFDVLTFALMLGAAIIGALWANYNRQLAGSLVAQKAIEEAQKPLVWSIFAIPFALFIGWFIARRREVWWALFICFCIYFFSTFVAARYESCTVLRGSFDLGSCFTATAEAQEAARVSGHVLYFQAILVIQLGAACVVALRQALTRSTIPEHAPVVAGSR